jgi:hypothetical protein
LLSVPELSSQVKLYYDRRSVGQSVLVSGTPFGPATNFSSFLELFLDSYCFNDVVEGRSYFTTDSQSVCRGIEHPCGTCDQILVKVKVTLQLTVSQSLCQGIEPILGLLTRYYFLPEGCFLKFAVSSFWGALSDERSGVICLSLSSNLPLFTSNIYVTYVLQFSNLYTMNIKLQSVPSEYSRLCSTSYY